MISPTTLYVILLILAGVVATSVAGIAWRRRHSPGGTPLSWMMAAMIIWSWTYALHWAFPNSPAPFFWLDTTYFGVVAMPGLVFVFTAQVSNKEQRFSRNYWKVLFIEPILTLLLLWTDPYHQLFYGDFRQMNASDIFNGGPWFWINVVYSYALFLVSFYFLIYAFVKRQGVIYRKQIGVCSSGLALLFVVNLLGVLGIKPLPGLDLTPILFTITGVLFAVGLLSYRMLDLVPVARDLWVDQMRDGMIVVDSLGRILDINQAASALFGETISVLTGKKFEDICDSRPGFKEALLPINPGSRQVQIHGTPEQVLDIQISPLSHLKSMSRGYLISWRDITRLKQIEKDLRRANESLQNKIEEINILRKSLEEQVIRDPLTGLFNRRFLDNVLSDELVRAEWLDIPISILIIDIDHFKRVNDRFGHTVGDLVLTRLSKKLEASIRKGDWVIRYGGEEFLSVMVDTPIPIAAQRAEQLRSEIERMEFIVGEDSFRITVSIGIAVFPDHGGNYEEIFRAADQSLYQAKTMGRNQVMTAAIPNH